MGLNFRSDQINKHVSFGYKWLDPGKYFQNIGLNTAYMSNHNFAGNKTNEMVFFMGHARLANFWIVNPIIGIGPKTYSDEKLRGGPLVISPAGMWSRIFIKTDTRKPIRYQLGTEFQSSEDNSYSLHISPGLEINLGTRLYMDLTPNFGIESRPYQYVEAFDDETATEMFNTRHIVAQMDRKTISADLRFDYTITPNLSIQAYVQPYISVGTYSHFKEFSKPKSYQFVEYGKTENFEIETDPEGNYNLYPNGFDGNIHYLYNPDFSYKSLVGSAVLRWEFRPGSTLYFVWTRTGSNDSNPGVFNFNNDIRDMFNSDVDNVFALKISYWIGK